MLKSIATLTGLAAVALAAQPGAAQAALGPDAAACRRGAPAILVHVEGFKARSGKLRVNLYGADPARFLQPGRYVRQVELPVTGSGVMPVCVAVPRAGRYAVAVRHDVKGDGNDWGDGGGFSRNPNLTLTNLRPAFRQVVFDVGTEVEKIEIVLNYRFGLSVRPVRS